jgi:hypothetical protein
MVNERVGASNWESGDELGDTWASRNAFSFGRGGERGSARPEVLRELLRTTDRVVQVRPRLRQLQFCGWVCGCSCFAVRSCSASSSCSAGGSYFTARSCSTGSHLRIRESWRRLPAGPAALPGCPASFRAAPAGGAKPHSPCRVAPPVGAPQEIDSVEYGLTDIQEYYANTGALRRAAQVRPALCLAS